ncbi:MAG: N-acetylglucosamine-6-phosphate deacetylase [Candidatus Aminicenantes bacterium]|nr:N-acetylglucosamine-6-phosphate deacetylase [Candidatus Aminicenantes bacterium]
MIEGERIAAVCDQSDRPWNGESFVIDHGRDFVSPGFIDLHIHGALGRNVMGADEEGLNIIGSHLIRSGATGFLPTILSAPLDSVCAAFAAVKRSCRFPLVSKPLGLHIEGPFLNVRQSGAQDVRTIRPMTEMDVEVVIDAAQGVPTILTLAPEIGQNNRFIPLLREKGIVVSIGHSDATYEQAVASIESGVTHAAHFFNAMRKFHHRDPGAVGAILESDGVTVEIVADGIHVHPASLKLVLDRKGFRNVCLVTDSIEAAGLGDGIYDLRGREIEVRQNRVFLSGGGTLAGSVLRMIQSVRNTVEWTDLPLNQAVRMASLNPARVLGLDRELGSITKGKYAHLTVFDSEFRIKQTYIGGKPML